MATIHLTKADFLTKIVNYEKEPNQWNFLGNKPALIDFFATWCGPCKALSPTLEEVSELYAGRVDIYKVDVDEESELAQLFNIRSVPSLLFIPMGEKPRLAQGAVPKKQLCDIIDTVLLKR